MKRIAVVTGASSGMGMEFIKQIINKYQLDEIWAIARRTDRLLELAANVSTDTCKIICITADLTNKEDRERIADLLSISKPSIKILANAAGYGLIGRFDSLERKDVCGMVALNCLALTDITHMCLKYMHKGAAIFQFASAAAFLPQPNFSVYAATKSYVLSFSRALNQECRKRNITVTSICPGPVKTEFFEIAEKTGTINSYKKLVMAEPEKVVSKAINDSKKGRSVSVYGLSMKAGRVFAKLLPHDLLMRFF